MVWTVSDIQKITRKGENQYTEFKTKVDMSRISKLISAFANTEGGTIIYGFDECKNAFVGLSKKEIENIEYFIKEDPMGNLCLGSQVEIEGKIIYVVSIKKSKEIIFANGVPYIRRGEQIIIPESKDFAERIHEHINSGRSERAYLEELIEGQKRLFEQSEELKKLLEAEKKERDKDKIKAKSEKWKSLIGGFAMGIITGVGANYVFTYLTTGSFSTTSVPTE